MKLPIYNTLDENGEIIEAVKIGNFLKPICEIDPNEFLSTNRNIIMSLWRCDPLLDEITDKEYDCTQLHTCQKVALSNFIKRIGD